MTLPGIYKGDVKIQIPSHVISYIDNMVFAWYLIVFR